MTVRVKGRRRHYRTVSFSARTNEVVLIEQRKLPHAFELTRTKNFNQTARAITNMTVRGAGAIGATAAYGLAQGARAFNGKTEAAFARHLQRTYETLAAARPTAVDLVNALNQVRAAMVAGKTISQKQKLALRAAQQFADDDVAHCEAIGKHGAKLIKNGTRVLTHCNAGWLAFVDIGSATAPMYAAQAKGKKFHVYCDETRPRAQGAALTAWELAQQGVSHEVIADNAAGHLMQRGEIDLVITGSDRTLGRTGEVANKIGTYTKAVLAARHNIPFYVAIPLSTLDWNLKSGKEIPIEERNAEEVLTAWGTDHRGNFRQVRTANPTSPARNPAFDVTPANLITGIITPKGIYKPRDLWRERKRLRAV
jgi:S-methyl-5-thioribose-1-phosphate isomerase